jgi:hypothetical protein
MKFSPLSRRKRKLNLEVKDEGFILISHCIKTSITILICAYGSIGRADQGNSSTQTTNTGFARPANLTKITITTPDSSNRIEFNHFQPLYKGANGIAFVDNTIYAKARPLDQAGEKNSFLASWGNSFRTGYRQLINKEKSYIGINGGYDNVKKDSYYYQQLGLGLELIYPQITVLATGNIPIGKSNFTSPGQEVQASYNLQATIPVLGKKLALTTRIYYIVDNPGESAPGGLAELTYSINTKCSLTYTTSYDKLSGAGYVLQLKYLFNPPNKSLIPSQIPYGTALPFSQALGNTGSRIIRLSGSTPAYGD